MRKTNRAFKFSLGWGLATSRLRREPESVEEYAEVMVESRASAFRDQQAFREAFPLAKRARLGGIAPRAPRTATTSCGTSWGTESGWCSLPSPSRTWSEAPPPSAEAESSRRARVGLTRRL